RAPRRGLHAGDADDVLRPGLGASGLVRVRPAPRARVAPRAPGARRPVRRRDVRRRGRHALRVRGPRPHERRARRRRRARGGRAKDPARADAVALLLDRRPVACGSTDAYGWYFASIAVFQQDEVAWRTWSLARREALLPTQGLRRDGCADGSWDPRADVSGRD